ncbi:MAG: ABC transporter transmembrane domain-containing protein, partial [Ezakiella massiliensis]
MKIVYKYFLDAIKNFKKHFVITFLISFLSAILTISIPIGLKFFLSKDLNTKDIILYIFIFLALIIASIYVSIIKIKTMDNYGGDYFKYILKRIQLTLYNTDYKNIDSLNKKGLSHTLYSDAMNVMSTVGVMIPSIISSLVITLSLLILAFYFNKVLAIFCAVSILIGVFISYFAREKMYSTSKQTNIKLKRIHDYIIEMIEMLMDTRHNKAEDYYLDKTDIIISDFIETAKDEDITRQLYNEIVINYNIIIQVVISILLSLPFINNSVSNAMFFILIFNLLINQGASIEAYVGKIISSAISFKNIDHILSLETPVEKININEIDSISIENLSFSYLDEKIIDGLKAEFKKGQTVLIQGSNGSGKSTLFKILLKYYS